MLAAAGPTEPGRSSGRLISKIGSNSSRGISIESGPSQPTRVTFHPMSPGIPANPGGGGMSGPARASQVGGQASPGRSLGDNPDD